MFKLLQKFHSYVARRLLNLSIGMRLLTLMVLGGAVAVLLAGAGILGLAASKESLRSVYEDRMMPIRQLAEVASLMLTNRLLLRASLSEVNLGPGPGGRPQLLMSQAVANATADAIERNIASINQLWRTYSASPLAPQERALADQYARSRSAFVNQALLPAIAALRAAGYEETKLLAAKAQLLYEQAAPDLQALNKLQFDIAREAYSRGVKRYENTRQMALSALGLAICLMAWLGLTLATSIVHPLKQVIAIFQRISSGRYDSPIAIQGRDEISQVMLALRDMQTKLGVDEKAIHQLAFYDPLTQLPNRRLLRDRLQGALSISERSQIYGAVVMIDLDNFKSINDTLGHNVGDQLLLEIAARIQSCVRQADTVARLGGDEFIVVLMNLGATEQQAALQAEGVAEKILRAVCQPCLLEQRLHHSTASMGLCLFLGHEATIDDLLKRADISMYQAKDSGRNALRFYDPQIQASLESRIALESELREALPRNQLRLYYQIQIDHAQGVLGAEVLLRWQHPKHGLVMPDQFIPIAEESGLILPIGEWVLRSACEQLKAWSANPATENLLLAVNVSAHQFRQPDFVAVVSRVLALTGVDPSRLKLELTESVVLHNINDTIEKIMTLNRQGVHFSMDDFGTGYSSLAHLTALPIQQLKIDRGFVRNIASSHNDAVMVQTIIGMAHNLGVTVIAEGVESEEQRACLERFGCLSYQGYLYGRPMPLGEFEVQALQAVSA